MRHLTLVGLAILICSRSAPAYIDHFGLYTLGSVIGQSTEISVLRVEKVSQEKRVIIYTKIADLKGKSPEGETRHQISDGFRPREPRLVMNWAEPGQIAVSFSNGSTAQICLGTFWYEAAARKEAPGWWTMTHVQSILSYAYSGSTERLRASVTEIVAGREVVIPAVRYTGDSNSQRLATYKNIFRGRDGLLIRMKASLKMAGSPLDGVQIVGTGGGGPEDLPPLTDALKNPDPLIRKAAAEDLGRMGPGGTSAVPVLGPSLKDADPRVRVAAAGALLAIDPKVTAALPLLIDALKDKSARVRRVAAETLAGLGSEAGAAGAFLAELLADPDGDVRWAAADALGELGPAAATAVPALLRLLADKDSELRGVAADALGQAAKGNPAAVAGELTRALGDGERRVRESAARSLLELGLRSRDAVALLTAANLDNSYSEMI